MYVFKLGCRVGVVVSLSSISQVFADFVDAHAQASYFECAFGAEVFEIYKKKEKTLIIPMLHENN